MLVVVPRQIFSQEFPSPDNQDFNIPDPGPFQGTGLNSFTPFQFFSRGEAVNLTNGNLNLNYTDAVIPGRAGLDVVIQRSYNFSHRNYPVTVDQQIHTGYFDVDRLDYDFGSIVNSEYLCQYLHERGAYGNDQQNCEVGEGQYIPFLDQLTRESLSTNTEPSLNDIQIGERKCNQSDCPPFFQDNIGPEPLPTTIETSTSNPLLTSLGSISTDGDNLKWMPPGNRWIISGSPYVGFVVFTNIFPFDFKGQFMAFLVRADGGIEVFNERGLKISSVQDYELFAKYIDAEGRSIFNPLTTTFNHNTSIDQSIQSIQITDENLKRYIFERNSTHTLYTKMMALGLKGNGDKILIPVNHIPTWKMDVFHIREIKDSYNNRITFDYNNGIQITDSLNHSIHIERNGNTIDLRLPSSEENRVWHYILDEEEKITEVIDPSGNQTTINYQCCSANPIRHFGNNNFQIDYFLEIFYPSGGLVRYELFSNLDNLGIADNNNDIPYGNSLLNMGAFVTEFPDSANFDRYYQKLIEIVKENDRADTLTTVHEVDGSWHTYTFRDFSQITEGESSAKTPLLIRKEIVLDNSPPVIEDYSWDWKTWEINRHHEGTTVTRINGISEKRTTKGIISYATTTQYNDQGLPSSVTDPLGNVTTFEYDLDAIADILSYINLGPGGPTPGVSLDRYKPPKIVHKITHSFTTQIGQAPQSIETFFYRGVADMCRRLPQTPYTINRVTRKINGGNEEMIREYCFNQQGNVTEIRSSNNRRTQYGYDDVNFKPISVLRDDERVVFTYDVNTGDVLRQSETNGQQKTFSYDGLGRLTSVQYENGSRIDHSYQLKRNVQGNSNVNIIRTDTTDAIREKRFFIARTYDGLGFIQGINENGFVTRYSYGNDKRLSEVSIGEQSPYQFQYDGLGRITQQAFPGSGSFSFQFSYVNENGIPTEKTDIFSGDQWLKSLYTNPLGQIIRVDQARDDQILTSHYHFNEAGLLLESISPNGLATRNIFDGKLRLIGRQYPGGDQIELNHTNNRDGLLDELVLQSLRGAITGDFNYNDKKRVTSIDFPNIAGRCCNDYSFNYDPNNPTRLLNLNDASGRTLFDYDTTGAITKIEKRELGPINRSYEFSYGLDAFGNDYFIGYPNGLSLYYVTDDNGRLISIRQGSAQGLALATFTYNDEGLVERVSYGNGTITDYTYSASNRVLSIRISKNRQSLSQWEYSYDDFGNKTRILYGDGSRVDFEYETGTHWLKRAAYYKANERAPYNVQNYTYDDEGNRLSYSDSQKSLDYEIDADSGQLMEYRNAASLRGQLTHDVRGNLLGQTETLAGQSTLERNFTYDFQDRLVSLEINDRRNGYRSSSQFTYDYASRRTQKAVDGETTYYLYGKSIEPMMEVDANGEAKKTFIYAGGRKIAALTGDDIEYFHNDELGNVFNVSNDTGKVVQSLRYDPFGNINFESSVTENPYQFAGKEKDEASGLIYFGARYYDPSLGRFITKDPAEDGFNHYIYARNNPVTMRDVFGLCGTGGCGGGMYGGTPATGGYIDTGIGGSSYAAPTQGSNPRAGIGILIPLIGLVPGVNASSLLPYIGGMSFADDLKGRTQKWPNFTEEDFKGITDEGRQFLEQPHVELSLEAYLYPESRNDDGNVRVNQYFSEANSPYPSIENPLVIERNVPINVLPTERPSIPQEITSIAAPQMASRTFPLDLGMSINAVRINFVSPLMTSVQRVFDWAAFNPSSIGQDQTFSGGSTPPPPQRHEVNSGGQAQPEDTSIASEQRTNAQQGNNEGDDPVLLFSGDLLQQERDLKISGRGFDYEFVRTYRSRINYLGPLGYGWDHNYDKRLIEQENGDIVRREGNARYDVYKHQDNGTYTSPAGFFDVLVKNGDGSFVITDLHGMIHRYDAQGFIVSMTDRNNNQMTFQYAGNGNERRLSSVTDTLGRVISYNYSNAGRLTSIQDFSGRRVSFGYDANNDLVSVTSPVTADFPQGKTVRYTYSSGFPEGSEIFNHNLLTATDAKGQTYLENEYTATDRVRRQRFGEGSFTYDYQFLNAWRRCQENNPSPDLRVSRTTVVDRSGNRSEYLFNCFGNQLQIQEFTRGLRPTDPASFITQFQYNQEGQISRVTYPEGNETTYAYQGGNGVNRGNLLSVTRVGDEDRPGGEPLTTTFTYENNFNQLSVVRESEPNHVMVHDFDQRGNIVRRGFVNILGINYRYAYNDHGQVTSFTDGEGAVTAYEYYAQGPQTGYLQRITRDTQGARVTNEFNYDAVGNIISFTDGRGNVQQFTVNRLNQVTQMRAPNPLGYLTNLVYDANDNVIRVEVENKNKDGVRDANLPWIVTGYDYDELDHLISKTEAITNNRSAITEYQYDVSENLVRVIQPEGNSINIIYDERDLPMSIMRGFGSDQSSITQLSYNKNGKVKQRLDGHGHPYTYDYDRFDRLVQLTDPLGYIAQFTYDGVDNLTNIQRRGPPNGQDNDPILLSSVVFRYDAINRITSRFSESIRPEDGRSSGNTYTYNANGFVTRSSDFEGHTTVFSYDGLNRLGQATDAFGNQVRTIYDGNGNIISQTTHEIDPDNNVIQYPTTYQYDALNRVTQVTDINNHIYRYAYDSRSNLVEATDPKNTAQLDNGQIRNNNPGNKVKFAYDGLNRMVQSINELRGGGTGGGNLVDQIITSYAYDDNSRLVALTDSNNHTTNYEYDALNRRVRTILPQNTNYTYEYDVEDNLIRTTDPKGYEVVSAYDDLNRLVEKQIRLNGQSQGSEVYEYDGLSRMTQAQTLMANGNVLNTVATNYDSLNRLTHDVQNGNIGFSEYDGVNNVIRYNYPGGRRIITKNYDVLNRLNGIHDVFDDFDVVRSSTYSGLSRLSSREFNNRSQITIEYDSYQRVSQVSNTNPAGVLISGFEYGYDTAGNRIYDRVQHRNNRGHAYSYDSAYRLTEAKLDMPDPVRELQNPGSQDYTKKLSWNIDKVNNWLGKTQDNTPRVANDGQQTNYTVNDLNQITQAGNQQIQYDPNGNIINNGTYIFDYDYHNLLVGVRDARNNTVLFTYEYDALGRRRAKVNAQTLEATQYFYDGAEVIEERDGRNQVIATYVYGQGLDDIISMERNDQQYFYHKDYLGSVVAITDENGNVVERYEYSPYGEVTILDANNNERQESAIGNRFMYTGREYDSETGLYYYRARYYDPTLGRFLQRDPIGYGDGMNLYAYVGNNPMNWIDPLGLCKQGKCINSDVSGYTGGAYDISYIRSPDFTSSNPNVNGILRGVNNIVGFAATNLNYINNISGMALFDLPASIENLSVSHGGPTFFEASISFQQATPLLPDEALPAILGSLARYSKVAKLEEVAGLGRVKPSFDIASTFRNGKFREITLKPGTVLERAFEEGKNSPIGTFLTRGSTARNINSTQEAVVKLGLKGTSNLSPNTISTLEVTAPIKAKIGFIEGGGTRAVQIVIDSKDTKYLEIIGGRHLGS